MLTQNYLSNLWSWASSKYTSEIAQACSCSSQHVRNVLQGKSQDETVIVKALELRKKILIQDSELVTFLLSQFKHLTPYETELTPKPL